MEFVAILALLCLTFCLVGKCRPAVASTDPDQQEIRDLTAEAYIYGLPLIMSYKTMYRYSVDTVNPDYKAPFNQLLNTPHVFSPEDRAIVTPNSDTPYSMMWLDLRTEPVVLSVPEIDEKRYYCVQLQDLNTFNFGYIGSRTTGNGPGCYMVTGPDWQGKVPEGINQVFKADADFAITIYRTQLFDPADIENVKAIQSGYRVQPLSDFLGTPPPPPAPKPAFPSWDEEAATGNGFIAYMNFCLQYISPDMAEKTLWNRLAKIGIGPGENFDYDSLATDWQKAISDGIRYALARIGTRIEEETSSTTVPPGGGDRSRYNGDWLLRAAITQVGWGANDVAEAAYPLYSADSANAPLDAGRHDYTLTFPKDGLPPVKAFWSVTLYDGKTQLLIDNQLKRYLINSPMLPNLQKNPDGSLTLYIQKDSPGVNRESNWLPAPDGTFYMILRLYWPSKEILDGTWQKPPVIRGNSS